MTQHNYLLKPSVEPLTNVIIKKNWLYYHFLIVYTLNTSPE